jgi:endonuclease/exonuclease/phosphatase family metal-dependent hydrolase
MRVLTWNLWWRFGPWEERQPAITRELTALAPDLALLQEVWSQPEGDDQAAILAAATGLNLARTEAPQGGADAFGNAVLSRWPLQVAENLRLSGPTGDPSHRSALACWVDAPPGPWLAVVTHLAWRYDESRLRRQQLAEVVELIDRHRRRDDDGPPVILAGDLNAVPASDEIRRLTGLSDPYLPGLVFTDCWDAVGDGPGHTWTRENPNAAEALWPRRRLDYVLVSWPRPRPTGNPLSARLVGVEPDGRGVVPSDHYGVLVELDDRPPVTP